MRKFDDFQTDWIDHSNVCVKLRVVCTFFFFTNCFIIAFGDTYHTYHDYTTFSYIYLALIYRYPPHIMGQQKDLGVKKHFR